MHSFTILTALGLATSALAAPAYQSEYDYDQSVSTDGSCGPHHSHTTCKGSGFGDSCSKHGQCGSTCNFYSLQSGCQPDYGVCYSDSPTSPDGTCGGLNGYTCLYSNFGEYCNKAGQCQATDPGEGCQEEYGRCTVCSTWVPQVTSTAVLKEEKTVSGNLTTTTVTATSTGGVQRNLTTTTMTSSTTTDVYGTTTVTVFGPANSTTSTSTSTTTTTTTTPVLTSTVYLARREEYDTTSADDYATTSPDDYATTSPDEYATNSPNPYTTSSPIADYTYLEKRNTLSCTQSCIHCNTTSTYGDFFVYSFTTDFTGTTTLPASTSTTSILTTVPVSTSISTVTTLTLVTLTSTILSNTTTTVPSGPSANFTTTTTAETYTSTDAAPYYTPTTTPGCRFVSQPRYNSNCNPTEYQNVAYGKKDQIDCKEVCDADADCVFVITRRVLFHSGTVTDECFTYDQVPPVADEATCETGAGKFGVESFDAELKVCEDNGGYSN